MNNNSQAKTIKIGNFFLIFAINDLKSLGINIIPMEDKNIVQAFSNKKTTTTTLNFYQNET